MEAPKEEQLEQHPVKNPRFSDVEQTGRWGEVTMKEKICVFVTVMLAMCAVGIAVFFAIEASLTPTIIPPASVRATGVLVILTLTF